ncbi:MAG: hypothetical protein Q9226_007028 [Calogaya cf. arnoldii]
MNTTTRPSKRLNQTDISSYFNIHSTFTLTHPTNQARATAATPYPTPQLPPTIQSSLLNVGMRVRKAVPEGYKTTKPLFDHYSTPRINNNGRGCGGYAELVPYCGISKVGGYMAQPPLPDEPQSSMFFGDEMFEDSVPSSQESILIESETVGLQWSRAAKRPLIIGGEVEDEDEDEETSAGRRENSGVLHDMAGSIALRPIAQARNRRPAAVTTRLKGACDSADFGEAPFLHDMDFGE